MAAEILTTKLFIPPPPPRAVHRPRLIERLNEGLHSKLLLVSAPAGFGKSTLLSAWLANCGRLSAWLSVDEADNDPTRFLIYLVAALQTIDANIGAGTLAMLQSPQPPPVESILTNLLNETAAISDSFLLVLDDYHLIESKPVDQALSFLIDHQPRQMLLVIATREDPNLPLARLRARGHLTELRASDLRFTPAEAAEFLNQVRGLNLSAEDIAALEARTEGWIAGLQLAAISMQGHPDAASFIKSFTGSHHFVLDYLVEEVLGQQSIEIQTFLVRTSILNRLCGLLCEAVLDTPSGTGQATLESLQRLNLFLVPLDNERRWYRYHHLFRELLRQRLAGTHELPIYHLRASEWFEANDDLTESFSHAESAGDFERAARLAEAAWQGMNRSFQTAAWLGWVKRLPDAAVRSQPGLCVQIGWAHSDIGELEASETHLQFAERGLARTTDPRQFKSLPGTIAMIRANNAQILGDFLETVRYAELSIQLAPEEDAYLRASAAVTLGFTHWAAGNLEASLQATHTWIKDMHKIGNQVFAIASAFAVADMLVILGRLGEAEAALSQAIQQAAGHGSEAETITAHHHLGLALLAHERGEDEVAAQRLQTAAELGKRTTLIDWLYRWKLAQACLKEAEAAWDAALELTDEAGRVYVKNPIPMQRPVEAIKARIYLKQGRLDKAAAWARERGLAVSGEVSYLSEYEYLTLARVRLSEGSFIGLDELLERLLALAENQNRTGSVIEILLVQALAHQAQGSPTKALTSLERALVLAEPEGYLRIFLDKGEAMRLLLFNFRSAQKKQASFPLHGYVDKILAGFSPPAGGISSATPANRTTGLIEPLTGRELEILRFIADGYSNVEISKRLYLALSTVKGHNLRIFSKLQAQNRSEAVARARELGLL